MFKQRVRKTTLEINNCTFSRLYAKWNENKVYRPTRQNCFGTTVGSIYYWKYCSITEPPRQQSLWIRHSLNEFNHNPLLSSLMNSHRVCNASNTTDATCGAATPHPPGAPGNTPGFVWGPCCSIFSFLCSVFSFVVFACLLFLFVIVLSVLLWFTASDYPFGIFKIFLKEWRITVRLYNILFFEYVSKHIILIPN